LYREGEPLGTEIAPDRLVHKTNSTRPKHEFQTAAPVHTPIVDLSRYACRAQGQQPSGIKFLADTLIIEVDGHYEADPDLATLSFDISAQDEDVKTACDRTSQSVQKILALAQKNGVAQNDISNGVLTIRPFY
jgi:uncharacterized protein YggE